MGNIDLMPRKKWMKILRKFVCGSISRALKWMIGLGGLTKLTVYVPISRFSFTQPKPEWTVNVANKQILFYNGEDNAR